MPAPEPGAAAERILVVAKPFIGDTVLAIPLLRNLRRAFPGCRIDVLALGPAADVLADCPHVDEIVAWRRPDRHRGPAWADAARLRSRGYTRAYLLKDSLSAAILVARAGIPRRIGLARDGNRLFLTRAVSQRRGRHQAELYLDLLRGEGLEVDDGRTENWAAAAATTRADALLAAFPGGRRRVFVAPEPTDVRRSWPAERWVETITWLVESRGCEVVFKGGPANEPLHESLRAALAPHVASHVHDVSRELSLRETGALLARMDLCVGVDTGPMHVAASFAAPVVVLFGPTDPNRWGPWSPRGEVVRPERLRRGAADRLHETWLRGRGMPPRWPFGTAAMADIAVADVIACIDRLLPPQPATPAFRTLDLRQGRHRYEVVVRPAAADAAHPVPSGT